MGNYSEAISWTSALAIKNRNKYGIRVERCRRKDYGACCVSRNYKEFQMFLKRTWLSEVDKLQQTGKR